MLYTYKKKLLFFSLLSFFILFFQNCNYFGSVNLIDRNITQLISSENNSNGGNGGIYEGKLTILLKYKDQSYYGNFISIYSGESFKFEISGGSPPYNFELVGDGFLDNNTQMYTAPFSDNAKSFDEIKIKDNSGNSATIKITVQSFTTSSKIVYPAAGTQVITKTSNTSQILFKNPSFFSTSDEISIIGITSHTDLQGNIISEIIESKNEGLNFSILKTFKFNGMLFITPSDELIFIAKTSNQTHDFWITSKNRSIWNKKNSLPLKYISNIFFAPNGNIYALGTTNDNLNSRNNWNTIISKNNGDTWNSIDQFLYQKNSQLYNTSPHSGLVDKNGIIWVAGLTFYQGNYPDLGDSRLIVRKSLDSGLTWITDFDFSYMYNWGQITLKADSQGNIYLASSQLNGSTNIVDSIFKRSTFDQVWNSVFTKSNGFYNFFEIDNLDNLLFIKYPNIQNTIPFEIFKSTDRGLTWSNFQNTSTQQIPEMFIKYKNNLFGILNKSENIEFYKSENYGSNWVYVSGYSGKSQNGGSTLPIDLIKAKNADLILFSNSVDSKNLLSWNSFHQPKIFISNDKGLSWANQTYQLLNEGYLERINSSLIDSSGDLYFSGEARVAGGSIWFVKKSVDNGKTWKVVDQYKVTSPNIMQLLGGLSMTQTENGNLFVTGQIQDQSDFSVHWITRRSIDLGLNWTNVDDINLFNYVDPNIPRNNKIIQKIKTCSSNNLFSFGGYGLFRKSFNSGLSWEFEKFKNIDPEIISKTIFKDLTCVSDNTIYLAGEQLESNNIILFKSIDKGLTWNLLHNETKMFNENINNQSNSKIIINTINFKNNSIWLGGMKQQSWSIFRIKLDPLELAEIDKLAETISSSVIKLINCENDKLCALGYEFSNLQEMQIKYKSMNLIPIQN